MAMENACLQSWPEPVVRVQCLSESGIRAIPERYIKEPLDRPCSDDDDHNDNDNDNDDDHNDNDHHDLEFSPSSDHNNAKLQQIPVIDLQNLYSKEDESLRKATFNQLSSACLDWGFFQLVNHGVSPQLMRDVREVWHEFFHLPLELKQRYANSPATYEGYGSRLGVEKGAKLDWSDYFFLNFLPTTLRDENKWPDLPLSCRELVSEYGEELAKLSGKLLKVLSLNLGLKEEQLVENFGGEEAGACLRVNFYPKCPQPDLTLGLSPHSDPGGITLLLPDHDVPGLQVRRDDHWLTVKPIPNAIIVNIGDQIQVMSNATYKSVEHRVIVNSKKERVSVAFFYNPKGDVLVKPAEELVTEEKPALYAPMTYNEYRSFIRKSGPCGKKQVESLISAT